MIIQSQLKIGNFMKNKILVLADSPTVSTGFGVLMKNVLRELWKTGRYEIDIIGINYWGDINLEAMREKYPFIHAIIPALNQYNDMYGRQRLMDVLSGRNDVLKPPYDILFTVQDHFILQHLESTSGNVNFALEIKKLQGDLLRDDKYKDFRFKWVGYWPVDGNLRDEWVSNAIAIPDYPVAYCNFGREQIMRFENDKTNLKNRLKVIRHGVNKQEFYRIKNRNEVNEFKKTFFKDFFSLDDVLVININRNQFRKDIARSMVAFKFFKDTLKKKYNKNAFLYLHCKSSDVGGNVFEIAQQIGLKPKEDFAVPSSFDVSKGYPVEILNKIYNSADMMITTTLGEGWGFSITEAMSAETLVLAPNITSIPEILNCEGDDISGVNYKKWRGIPVKSGSTSSEWVCLGQIDNEVVRPIVNVEDLAAKMVWAYEHKKECGIIKQNALDYTKEISWENECKKWVELFDEAVLEAKKDKEKQNVKSVFVDTEKKHIVDGNGDIIKSVKFGRNDLCWCSSGLKYKRCHGK